MKPIKGIFFYLKKPLFCSAEELTEHLSRKIFKPLTDGTLISRGFISPLQAIDGKGDFVEEDVQPLVLKHPDPLFDGLFLVSFLTASRYPKPEDVNLEVQRRLEELMNHDDAPEVSEQEKETIREEVTYQLGKSSPVKLQRQTGCIDINHQQFYIFSTKEADASDLRGNLRDVIEDFALITPVNEQGCDFADSLTDTYLGPYNRRHPEKPATQDELEAKHYIDSVAYDDLALGSRAHLAEGKNGEKITIDGASNLRDLKFRNHLKASDSMQVVKLELSLIKGERGSQNIPRRYVAAVELDHTLKVNKAYLHPNEEARLQKVLGNYENPDFLADQMMLHSYLMQQVVTTILPAFNRPVMPYVEAIPTAES